MGELRTWRAGDPLPLPADVEVWEAVDMESGEPDGAVIARSGGGWLLTERTPDGEVAQMLADFPDDCYLREVPTRPIRNAQAPLAASLRTMLGYGEAWAALIAAELGEGAVEVQGMRRKLAEARAALARYDRGFTPPTVTTRYGVTETACTAGQADYPAECDRHARHHWCGTCRGYYGVPHDGIHTGRSAHPNNPDSRSCVCRVCTDWRAERGSR